MATPKKTSTTPPAPEITTSAPGGVPLFAQARATTTGLTSGPMRFKSGRGPWTYLVNAGKLGCSRGVIVPLLAKAWHEPGLNGNDADPRGRGDGFIAAMRRDEWVPVPHDFPAVAFGAQRVNQPVSSYLDRYEGIDGIGRPCVYYSNAWARPRRVGRLIDWQRDVDGWNAWRASLLPLTGTDELLPAQVALAVDPLARRIRDLLLRDTVRSRHEMRGLLADMPREHAPPDILELIEEHLTT